MEYDKFSRRQSPRSKKQPTVLIEFIKDLRQDNKAKKISKTSNKNFENKNIESTSPSSSSRNTNKSISSLPSLTDDDDALTSFLNSSPQENDLLSDSSFLNDNVLQPNNIVTTPSKASLSYDMNDDGIIGTPSKYMYEVGSGTSSKYIRVAPSKVLSYDKNADAKAAEYLQNMLKTEPTTPDKDDDDDDDEEEARPILVRAGGSLNKSKINTTIHFKTSDEIVKQEEFSDDEMLDKLSLHKMKKKEEREQKNIEKQNAIVHSIFSSPNNNINPKKKYFVKVLPNRSINNLKKSLNNSGKKVSFSNQDLVTVKEKRKLNEDDDGRIVHTIFAGGDKPATLTFFNDTNHTIKKRRKSSYVPKKKKVEESDKSKDVVIGYYGGDPKKPILSKVNKINNKSTNNNNNNNDSNKDKTTSSTEQNENSIEMDLDMDFEDKETDDDKDKLYKPICRRLQSAYKAKQKETSMRIDIQKITIDKLQEKLSKLAQALKKIMENKKPPVASTSNVDQAEQSEQDVSTS